MIRKTFRMAAVAAVAAIGAYVPAQAQPTAAAGSSAGLTLSAAERAAILPLKQAVDMRNWAAAQAALPAARAAVRGNDARYAVARLELDVANATNDRQALPIAIGRVLELRRSPTTEQVQLLRQYAALVYDAGNRNAAEQTLNRVLQLAPSDAEALAMLGHISRSAGNNAQAIGYFQRAFRAAESTNVRMPESRYRYALALAEQAQQRPAVAELGRDLVSNYPTTTNWRDALLAYRGVPPADAAADVDIYRLLRAAGGLSGERDYYAMVRALAGVPATESNVQNIVAGLGRTNLAAEAKAVLDEGVAAHMLDAQDNFTRSLISAVGTAATRERSQAASQAMAARSGTSAAAARGAGDSLLGAGRYAEAAELYRLALTRAGEDANLVNSRLGEALALAGQRAEAEAALRAVTGPRAELAGLWLAWVLQRPAA